MVHQIVGPFTMLLSKLVIWLITRLLIQLKRQSNQSNRRNRRRVYEARCFYVSRQGSQVVGMGEEIYNNFSSVKTLYENANNVLDKDLTSLMFEGPKEKLTETENAQPALLLSSVAIHSLLIEEEIQPVMTVGHSLGEYSALVSAGALALDDALPLVHTRGQLMEEAFPKGQGTMAAV